MTRKFEEETGITVELINMGWDNVADRVTAEMSSGGSSYDVTFLRLLLSRRRRPLFLILRMRPMSILLMLPTSLLIVFFSLSGLSR